MKQLKNPLILTLMFIGFVIAFSFIIALITIILKYDSIVLPALSGIFAAVTLKLVYNKINKEIIPRKTKLAITITYIALQQMIGFFYALTIKMETTELLSYLGIQFIMQLAYGAIIYLFLSSWKITVDKVKKRVKF